MEKSNVKRLEEICEEIKSIDERKTQLEKEKAKILDEIFHRTHEVIDTIPAHARKVFKNVGITTDLELINFLDGDLSGVIAFHERAECYISQLTFRTIYRNKYKKATSRRERLDSFNSSCKIDNNTKNEILSILEKKGV